MILFLYRIYLFVQRHAQGNDKCEKKNRNLNGFVQIASSKFYHRAINTMKTSD